MSNEVLLQAQWGPELVVVPHLATRLLLQRPEPTRPAPDKVFHDNASLWNAILRERARVFSTLRLEGFWLSDWFPRAPGLFHTGDAAMARADALHYRVPVAQAPRDIDGAGLSPANFTPAPDASYRQIFAPQGKLSMLQGGLGCIRLRPFEVGGGEPFWLMSASSNGVMHEGFPVAMRQQLYDAYCDRLYERGLACCTLVGKLRFLPNPLGHLAHLFANVPALYLDVEEVIEVGAAAADEVQAAVTVAVSFTSAYESEHRAPQIYASYVTFDPRETGGLERAAEWLKETYVEGMYRGKILTDFDQIRGHFPEAALSLLRVMGRRLTEGEVEDALRLAHVAARADQIFRPADLAALLAVDAKVARTRIFVSYSHADAAWLERLRVHLAPLVHLGKVDFFADTALKAGERWQDEIEAAIDGATISILLLSPNFLASKFVFENELPRMLAAASASGLTILPLFVADCLIEAHPKLARIQAVNPRERALETLGRSEQDELFIRLARRVLELTAPNRP